MPDDNKWFITERVRALAIVLLTRRADLAVTEAKQEYDLDLLVEIKNRRSAVRRFGVLLHGTLSPVDEQQANQVLRPVVQRFQRSEPPSFPACLFYFTMQDDQGYYTWLTEPVIREHGRPLLRVHDSASVGKLNDAGLAHIVQRVNAWYDALFEPVPGES